MPATIRATGPVGQSTQPKPAESPASSSSQEPAKTERETLSLDKNKKKESK